MYVNILALKPYSNTSIKLFSMNIKSILRNKE